MDRLLGSVLSDPIVLKTIGETKRTILEVAAGYSHIVIKALEADAKSVFANDIVAHQLQIINILSAAAVRESAHPVRSEDFLKS
jgi:hypothetical protein